MSSIDFKNMEVVKPYTKHEMTIFKAALSPPIFVSNYMSWGRWAWRLARDTEHRSWNRLSVWTQGQCGSTGSQHSAFNSQVFKNLEHTWQKTLRLFYKYQSVDVVFGKCPLFRHKRTVCVHCSFWELKCVVLEQGRPLSTKHTVDCSVSNIAVPTATV